MKKYFLISDIHGFYDAMTESLTEAGYDPKNKDHVLVVLGDLFDRGDNPKEIKAYLDAIPDERKILIRGNHEALFRDLIRRKAVYNIDISNGTFSTLCDFCGYHGCYDYFDKDPSMGKLASMCDQCKWYIDWVFGKDSKWVNYFELGNYIMVHSWVPILIPNDDMIYDGDLILASYNPDWRKASQHDWEMATWVWPIRAIYKKLLPPKKTMIFGHWCTSDLHSEFDEPKPCFEDNTTFVGKRCIGLDATTVISGYCNVVVLEQSDDGKVRRLPIKD